MTSQGERDEAWYEQLVKENEKRVMDFLYRMLRDRHFAMDAAQDTLMIAWRRRDKVPDEPRSWLLATARNVGLNYRRKIRRDRHEELDLESLDAAVVDPTGAQAIDISALSRLSASERLILDLSCVDELDGNEIAVVLGISPQTARKRLQRARDKAGKLLDQPRRERRGGRDEQR